jgi:hypothetical protein
MKKLLPIFAVLLLTLSLFGCKTVDSFLSTDKLWDPNSTGVSEESTEETSAEEVTSAESSAVKTTTTTTTKKKPVLGREWSEGAVGSEDIGPINMIEFLDLPISFDRNIDESNPGGSLPAATILSCEMNKDGSVQVFIRKDSGHTSTFRVAFRFLDAQNAIVSSGILSVDYTVGAGATTEQIIRAKEIPETAAYLEFTGLA